LDNQLLLHLIGLGPRPAQSAISNDIVVSVGSDGITTTSTLITNVAPYETVEWHLSIDNNGNGANPADRVVTGNPLIIDATDGLLTPLDYTFDSTVYQDATLIYSETGTFSTFQPGLVISNVLATVAGDKQSVTFTFTTNIASDTGVEWGPTSAYGTAIVAAPSESVTSHSITAHSYEGILPNALAHFRVSARIGITAPVYAADYTFDTH
jgi:hypothetical protein